MSSTTPTNLDNLTPAQLRRVDAMLEERLYGVTVAKTTMHLATASTLPLAICSAVMAAEGLKLGEVSDVD